MSTNELTSEQEQAKSKVLSELRPLMQSLYNLGVDEIIMALDMDTVTITGSANDDQPGKFKAPPGNWLLVKLADGALPPIPNSLGGIKPIERIIQ